MLSFEEARERVTEKILLNRVSPTTEIVGLDAAPGRILASSAQADRDYPALNRSVRDGFAVRSCDLPGKLQIIGESRAGGTFAGTVCPGQAVEIMTGAPVPMGADCVVMVEHVTVEGQLVTIPNPAPVGQFISFRGEEATSGQQLIPAGRRITYTDIALLATTGHAQAAVYRKPRVAILPTGDELVPVHESPSAHQIRNCNSHSLAAQVIRAGAKAYSLPPARDNEDDTRQAIERALSSSDLLLLSGGVSAGKYDIVEKVLAQLGAEFFFDRVAIQPGQPLVFGRVQGKFFFGLPGNPGSTMVTFELFARAAIELLSGQTESELPFALGRLTQPFRHKPVLTRFLPALLSGYGDVTPLPWKGSSDIPAISRANVFLVASSKQAEWAAGDTIPVLFK
jgi:molybdopterin molybdotransferase